MSQRFGTSARQGENGFVRRRIVSSHGRRRNNSASMMSDFKEMGFRRWRYDPTWRASVPGPRPGFGPPLWVRPAVFPPWRLFAPATDPETVFAARSVGAEGFDEAALSLGHVHGLA